MENGNLAQGLDVHNQEKYSSKNPSEPCPGDSALVRSCEESS